MSNQLQITGGAKVRNLEGVITGSTGVLNSLPINGANGIPQLDSSGKILVSQLPNSVMEYQGTWNVATNTPYLVNGVGNAGDVYLVTGAATGGTNHNFGAGNILFYNGDQAIYDGSAWQRASGSSGTVTSVAVTESSAALNITGSPITTSGTINIGFAGTSAQYVAGDGSLITFPSTINNATNLLALVRNNTGATIPAGSLVYITGGLGNHAVVSLAEANSEATSSQTFGMMQYDLANNADGYVVISGQVTDLDTSAYADGTILYLSPTVPGGWTATKPVAPNHMVYVGTVIYSHAIHGTIQTRIQNGYELQELHNVLITSPTNGNILQYDASTSLWKNVEGITTNIAEGTNLYYTDARVRAALSATTPLSFNSSTGAFSISQSNTSTNGYLSSTDWNTFNNKQNALGYVPIGGSGSINYVAKFTGPTTISNSIIYDDGTTAQIGGSLTVQGNLVVSPSSGFPQATILGAATTELRIQTSSASYTSDIRFTSGPTATYGLLRYDNTNNYLTFYTNSIAYSRLFNNGNFVIGSTLTDNGFKLEVQGTAKISSQLTLGSTITNGTYTYTLPSATGTLALTSNIPTISGTAPISYSAGVISISQANTSTNGYLSSTDWNTFNNKQSALTNPVTGTGTSGYVTYWNGTATVAGSSNHYWDNTNGRLGIGLTNPQRSLEVYSATADNHLRLSGTAPSVSMGEAITGSIYQAKFGLATASGQYAAGAAAGDFVIISQTGNTIWATSGGEKMRLIPSGNLLIGTTTDSGYKLDVTGTGRFTGKLLLGNTDGEMLKFQSATSTGSTYQRFYNSAGTARGYLGLFWNGTSDYMVYDAGSLQMNFNSSNGFTFTGTGAATFSSSVTVSSYLATSSGNELRLYNGLNNSNFQLFNSAGSATSNLNFYDASASAYRMVINTSGNVGINTTDPKDKLDVNGSIRIRGNTPNFTAVTDNGVLDYVPTSIFATSPVVRLAAIGTSTVGAGIVFETGTSTSLAEILRLTSDGYIVFAGSATTTLGKATIENTDSRYAFYSTLGGGTTKDMLFQAGGSASAPNMTLKANGNFLVGTTTDNGNKLQVNGNITLITANTRLSSDGNGEIGINYGGAGTSTYSLAIYNNTTRIGGVNSTTGVYVALSDSTKKKDFELSTIGLNEVLQLKPTLFRMKSEDESKPKQLGFLAQEVKNVIPQAYVEQDNFIGLQDRPIIAALVKAVQELQQQINDLKIK